MLTTKIYDEFVEITGLRESVYRSVFSKIEEFLVKTSNIKFKVFKYRVGDNEAVINLTEGNIPIYNIEIIHNMFEKFYNFPEDSYFELLLEYNNIEHKIIYDKELIIDNEISFIKDKGVFNLFLLKEPVVDIFAEFDRYFNFITMFNSKESEIFPIIKERLDNKYAGKVAVVEELSDQAEVNNLALINTLENSQKEVFEQLKNIKVKLSEMLDKRIIIIRSVNTLDNLIFRKNKLEADNNMYSELVVTYSNKLNEITEVLTSINKELTAAAEFNKEGVDVEFFIEKKLMFEEEVNSIIKLKLDTETLIAENFKDLKDITTEIGLLNGYNKDDLSVVESNIAKYEQNQDILYAEMLALEGKIKELKLKKLENEKELSKAGIAADGITLHTLDNKIIIDHIVAPKQPTIVTAVVKYLKYIFAYNATKLFATLDNINNYSTYDLQAIACRKVLSDIFGYSFNSVFSVYPMINDSIIKVVK
jgi:hypothetical protein